jgi:hypothetical protein
MLSEAAAPAAALHLPSDSSKLRWCADRSVTCVACRASANRPRPVRTKLRAGPVRLKSRSNS